MTRDDNIPNYLKDPVGTSAARAVAAAVVTAAAAVER